MCGGVKGIELRTCDTSKPDGFSFLLSSFGSGSGFGLVTFVLYSPLVHHLRLARKKNPLKTLIYHRSGLRIKKGTWKGYPTLLIGANFALLLGTV